MALNARDEMKENEYIQIVNVFIFAFYLTLTVFIPGTFLKENLKETI